MDTKKKQPPKWWLRYEEMYVLKEVIPLLVRSLVRADL